MRKTHFPALILISLFYCSTQSRAQEPNVIQGRIISKSTNQPIPFATIKLKSKSAGVISNVEGDFKLPFKYKSLKDTIVISCIGFVSKLVPLNQLQDSLINTIKIEESLFVLKAVEITSKRKSELSAYKVVKTAIENIGKNYPRYPFSYDAYYRDYQLSKNEYINLNEAIVEIVDNGFETDDRTQSRIKLYEYQINDDFSRDSTTEVAYDNREKKFIPNAKVRSFGGNELTILRVHDAIRNYNTLSFSFVYELKKNFFKQPFLLYEERYTFRSSTIVLY
jgi:hypothetical protein